MFYVAACLVRWVAVSAVASQAKQAVSFFTESVFSARPLLNAERSVGKRLGRLSQFQNDAAVNPGMLYDRVMLPVPIGACRDDRDCW